jgi:hypothetical protein
MEEAPLVEETVPSLPEVPVATPEEQSQQSLPPRRELSIQSTDGPASLEAGGADMEEEQPPAKRARREKKSKGKTLLSAELYRSMTAMLGLILKSKQEQALDAAEAGKAGAQDAHYDGCRWGDLVTAYLAQVCSPPAALSLTCRLPAPLQCQHEITDLESFDQQKKLVNQVSLSPSPLTDRLTDRLLLASGDPENGQARGDPHRDLPLGGHPCGGQTAHPKSLL